MQEFLSLINKAKNEINISTYKINKLDVTCGRIKELKHEQQNFFADAAKPFQK